MFAIKGRPADHPLIVHLAEADQATEWAARITETARRLMVRFWPGPLTLVLPARDDVPRAFGGGLAAPSANRFGAVSPTEAEHVRASLGNEVDIVLDGGPCRYGLESTIVSLLDERPRVLRPGALSLAALREALGGNDIEIVKRAASSPRVPGALAAHYAPATPLEIHARGVGAPRRIAIGPRTAGGRAAPQAGTAAASPISPAGATGRLRPRAVRTTARA